MDKKTKDLIILIVSIVAVVSTLFLPFYSAGGMSMTFMEVLDKASALGANSGIGDYLVFASIIGGGIAIYFAAVKQRKNTMICSIVGAGGLGLFILILSGELSKVTGGQASAFDIIGAGVWIALIAYIANIVLCAKEDAVVPPPVYPGNDQFNNPNQY